MSDTCPPSVISDAKLAGLAQLASSAPPGCFVEVGVYRGGSAWRLAKVARDRRCALHLFDTFLGIPHAEHFDTHRVGDFGNTSAAMVRLAIPDAVFHVGLFPVTLPPDLKSIAFVHCDCVQYYSVRAVIDELMPRMVPGGIMAFDDVDTEGGRKAISESFGSHLVVRHGWAIVTAT